MRFRFVFLCKGTDKRLLHKVFGAQTVKKCFILLSIMEV